MHSKWFSLILPLVAMACLAWGHGLEPYCHRNVTQRTVDKVVRTRYTEKKSWMGLRSKKVPETYTEEVPKIVMTVVRECCPGFEMSPLKLCEPVCLAGCPAHATCLEPNKCQCDRDYVASVSPVDGAHSCTPFCEHPCPANSHCVEPNKCHCAKGYALTEQHLCEPVCHSGCAASGGKCIAPGVCECEDGSRGFTCESNDAPTDASVTTEKPVNGDDESMSSEEEDDDDSVGDDQSEEDGEGDSFVSIVEAATENNLPREFASNEFDCRNGPCPENSQCLSNGTCVCPGGYWMYADAVVADDDDGEEGETTSSSPLEGEIEESTSVSSVTQRRPICVKSLTMLEAEEKSGVAEAADGGSEDSPWMSAFFIALGLTCMACAAVFLGVKLMRHRHNSMDVEAKNDIRCVYDSREDSEPPMVY